MAISKIDVCNLALASLGADAIRSFDEHNKRSRMASNFFNSTRDYLLSKFDWPFARKYAKLEEVDSITAEIDVPEGFTIFGIPSDCRTPRDILPEGSKTPWSVVGLYIMIPTGFSSNYSGNVYLKYTHQALNTLIYSDTFSNLLALGIAVRMAPAITQDKTLTNILYEQYAREQLEVWESDANIGNAYRMHDEDPNNDKFVYPDGHLDLDDESRYLASE